LLAGLDLLNPRSRALEVAKGMSGAVLRHGRNLRSVAFANGALVAATVVSGAYVAGNDAGRAYNSFPLMGDVWVPEEILEMTPLWRNFFENTATVQFDHRVLAMSTLAGVWGMYFGARKAAAGAFWKSVPSYTRLAFNAVAGMSVAQVALGISTLLLYVPVPLAAVHQAGSLTLLTLTTCLAHSLRFATVRASAPGMARAATGSAAGGVDFSRIGTTVLMPKK
jgi:cytochrome c oxidase assembly protein subunit 15